MYDADYAYVCFCENKGVSFYLDCASVDTSVQWKTIVMRWQCKYLNKPQEAVIFISFLRCRVFLKISKLFLCTVKVIIWKTFVYTAFLYNLYRIK